MNGNKYLIIIIIMCDFYENKKNAPTYSLLQTIHTAKVKAALKASKEDVTDEKLNELVCLEIEKEKRILDEEFMKKVSFLSSLILIYLKNNRNFQRTLTLIVDNDAL